MKSTEVNYVPGEGGSGTVNRALCDVQEVVNFYGCGGKRFASDSDSSIHPDVQILSGKL